MTLIRSESSVGIMFPFSLRSHSLSRLTARVESIVHRMAGRAGPRWSVPPMRRWRKRRGRSAPPIEQNLASLLRRGLWVGPRAITAHKDNLPLFLRLDRNVGFLPVIGITRQGPPSLLVVGNMGRRSIFIAAPITTSRSAFAQMLLERGLFTTVVIATTHGSPITTPLLVRLLTPAVTMVIIVGRRRHSTAAFHLMRHFVCPMAMMFRTWSFGRLKWEANNNQFILFERIIIIIY